MLVLAKQMTRSFLVVLAMFAWIGAAMAAPAEGENYSDTVTIVKGQTTLLPYPGVIRVSIGEEEIANAQPTGPSEILLTGLKAGVTDLRIWSEGGSQKRFLLRVIDNSWVRVLEVANIVLADVEGVNAREENGIVFIEGRILREQDLGMVEDLRKKLSKEIGAGTVVFNVVKPNVNLQAMIMMDVQVVEVRRQELNKIGIQWDSATGGPAYGVAGVFTGAGNFEKLQSAAGLPYGDSDITFMDNGLSPGTAITSTLNFLQTEGVARILAQPKLVTRSGSQAQFLAGGEVPIPIESDGELSVTFKQVGVILEMSPVADPDGFIETLINVEVSSVDDSVQVRGIPGFTTRKTKMEMNVLSGQTMVISGMLQAEDSKAVDKLPGISKIPILGELFKSRDFQERTTELMIFVTPYLVDPESKKNKDLLDRANELDKNGKEDASRFSIFD